MSKEMPLPLAPRDLLILAVLGEGPLHGYGIIKAVEARSQAGVLLDPANLYRVLRRMRREEWIREVSSGEGAGGGGDASEGPQAHASSESRRRTYAITRTGRALLAAELARLERLLHQARPAVGGGT